MKVLFFTQYNATPHLETELEIALKLRNHGHEVYILYCKGELGTCYENSSHLASVCRVCFSKKEEGFKLAGFPAENILRFPTLSIDHIPVPDSFPTLKALKDYEFEGIDIGMGVVSSLISEHRDHKLDPANFGPQINTGIKTSLYSYLSFKEIVEKIKPDQVYLFNGRFLEIRPLMRICEHKGIDFFTHERGGTFKTYLCRKNGTPHSLKSAADEINDLWGDGGQEKEKKGALFFTDRRNRQVQAWHVFTEDQVVGKLPAQFDKKKRNFVFFNSSMDEYEGIAGFTGKIYSDDHEGIISILNAFRLDAGIHFFLRAHPNLKNLKNSQNEELKNISRSFSNLTFIPPEDSIDTYALMDACEKTLVFNSTMGAEAVYWNKPVILLGNSFYGSLNCFYKPESPDEAISMVRDTLPALDKKPILKYGYWELHKGIPYEIYKPESLTTGTFLGKRLQASPSVKIINFTEYYFRRILRIFPDLFKKSGLLK